MRYGELIETLNVDAVTRVVNCSELSDHDKRKLIGYLLFKDVQGGLDFRLPTKAHKTDYADVLIRYDIEMKEIVELAGVSENFIYKRKRQ
jgi:hypothetical protein